MHWTAPGRCLVAWDGGQGPTFARRAGGAYLKRKAFASFDVYRTTDPADLVGILIGSTRAEAFIDFDAPEGAVVYYRVVGTTAGGGTLPIGGRITAIIPRRLFAAADTTPPSPPDDLRVRLRDDGNLLQWSAASDAESGLLAYLVYESDQTQPDSVVWANDDVQANSHAVRRFLDRTEDMRKHYRLRAVDCALNVSDGPISGKVAEGWTVYTFRASSRFTLKTKETIHGDRLLVGGGGTGGAGNCEGGGGGGGGVIDQHNVAIVAGRSDGEVIVGLGGHGVSCEDAAANLCGNNGDDSSFGGVTAKGGGYGAAEGEHPSYFSYEAADGASGGGGSWAGAGAHPDGASGHLHGHGGKADAAAYEVQTDIPYADGDVAAYWTAMRENGYAGGIPSGYWIDPSGKRFWTVTRPQGHDGGDGNGYGAWYNITDGGGGGAHDPYLRDAAGELVMTGGHPWPYFTYDQFGYMQSGNPEHGKHGVPCDIAGWHMYEETAGALMFVDWYGGGGAGKERKVWWGYANGKPGYGGGGECNQQGVDGTGGGGGGAGAFPTDMPGPAGGNGVVIIRIRTCDEDLVTYPLITGTDPEATEFGLPVCLCADPSVKIRRLPEHMTHNDESGDEQCPRTYEETH